MNSIINRIIKIELPLVLASASPRRRHLLSLLGFEFQTAVVEIDENDFSATTPGEIVCELAERKANEAAKFYTNNIIITADTLVFLDGHILTKPSNQQDAYRILKLLSGQTHQVFTGIAVINSKIQKKQIEFVRTDVTFRSLDDAEIWAYIETGSPMDKAGAYGIQDDFGAVFVERIDGDYYNVVGLPLCKLYSMLKQFVDIPNA